MSADQQERRGLQGRLVFHRVPRTKGSNDPDHMSAWFLCPGCDEAHRYEFGKPGAWTFNGDYEKPTFTPSLLMRSKHGPERRPRVCHLFMTDGKIRFLGDCTHALAGRTVEIPEPPEWLL